MDLSNVILDLDKTERDQAIANAWIFGSQVHSFRISNLSIIKNQSIIHDLSHIGKVFLDCNLYDNIDTLVETIAFSLNVGVSLVSVNAFMGKDFNRIIREFGKDCIVASLPYKKISFLSAEEVSWEMANTLAQCDISYVCCNVKQVKYLSPYNFKSIVRGIHSKADYIIISAEEI